VIRSDPEFTSFDRSSPWRGCKRPKAHILYICLFTMRSLTGGGSHVTANHVTWPQVTRSDPEVTSFDRKSPWSGCRRPKTRVYCTFHFLQGCRLQEEAVTWQQMTSCDLRWPEVTRKWSNLTECHLEVAVEGQKLRILYISLPIRM